MIDENTVYVPGYLSGETSSEEVYVPSFLSTTTDNSGIAVASDWCGDTQTGCCTTECSQYGMGSCGEVCTEACVETCTETCSQSCYQCTNVGQYCGDSQGGCCTTECSQYYMEPVEPCEETCGEGCGETDCGEDCGESDCGEDCGESDCGEDCGEEDDGEITASITVRSVTSDSATLYITVDPDYQYYRIFCRMYDNEDDTTLDVYGLSRTSNFTYTITGLVPDTEYILNLGVNNTGAAHCTWVYSGDNPTFWTDEDSEFVWTYVGLDTVGNPVLGDSKISGYGVYVTAAEWNEYIAFVNDKFGTALSTVTRGTKISASIVNTAAAVVGAAQTSSGLPITASFFNNLKDAANK